MCLIATAVALAVGGSEKGQGAIVIRDDAPVYDRPAGDEVVYRLRRGDAVAGNMGAAAAFGGASGGSCMFDEKQGRLHVSYLPDGKKMARDGWMNPSDLSKFTHEACGRTCSPFMVKNFTHRWNACFEEARDNKLDQLRVLWAQQDAAKASAPTREEPPKAEEAADR